MLLPYCARYFCLPFYESPRHVKKWKKQLLVFIKYGRFWSIFLKLFSKLKLWNWEEWVLVSTNYMFFCSWSAKEVVHRWLRISYCVKKYVLYGLLLLYSKHTRRHACSYTKSLSLITLHQAIRGTELYTNVQNVCYTSVF